jgi:N-acetylglucosaminyldiphosphoundecaprenol N-acetyl-beta-D-mannosaminyltransferase
MYLRYREQSWETADAADSLAAKRRADVSRSIRRRHAAIDSTSKRRRLPTVELLGVKLHSITEAACIGHVLAELEAGNGGIVITPNLDHLRRYLTDVNFGALVAEADLVVPDGMPLVWASRLQGTPLPERVAGSNLISSLSKAAAERGRSIYLLGGAPGTAEGAARVLLSRHPNLKIAGFYYPPLGFEHDPREMANIIANLSQSKADIVYVALGSPKQERLIARLRPILPDSWWLGVGNSFSFLCGDVRRAPLWMQKVGLEWSHRLLQEPRRLFKRYVMVGIPFATRLLGRSAIRGMARKITRRPSSAPPVDAPASIEGEDAFLDLDGSSDVPAAAPAVAPSAAEVPPPVDLPSSHVWTSSAQSSGEESPLSRLRALVLLGGAVRANPLVAASGRSVLDLPLDENGSVLNFWLKQAADVARIAGLEKLPVRVMVNQTSPEPCSADPRYLGMFRVERDLSEYRGTGGVLHDLAQDYHDDDMILVANAAQVLLDPLSRVLIALRRKRADVAVISHADGTPSGIMLVRRKTLHLLPAAGFVDMKEQGLPAIASQYDVRVVHRRRPTGLPIRTLDGYVQALHYYHRRRSGARGTIDPLAEDWSPAFSLIEPGASVDPSARVHDSVVLAGARVEGGAVVVRSLVCPSAVIRRDRTAVDEIIRADRDPRRATRGFGRPIAAAW